MRSLSEPAMVSSARCSATARGPLCARSPSTWTPTRLAPSAVHGAAAGTAALACDTLIAKATTERCTGGSGGCTRIYAGTGTSAAWPQSETTELYERLGQQYLDRTHGARRSCRPRRGGPDRGANPYVMPCVTRGGAAGGRCCSRPRRSGSARLLHVVLGKWRARLAKLSGYTPIPAYLLLAAPSRTLCGLRSHARPPGQGPTGARLVQRRTSMH